MKKTSTVYSIIRAVGFAGAAGVVVVAPNTLQVFEAVASLAQKKQKPKTYTDYLRRSGYFELQKTDNNTYVVRLSVKGDKAYRGINFADYLKQTKAWDGGWHLLMFDIPEQYRPVRQYVSRELNAAGLRPIQDSVFVYPYDLSPLADAIREEYPKVAALILSAKVSTIDGAAQLRTAFRTII